jgi:hypothetical protein
MVSKNNKSVDKKANSIEEITKRLDKLDPKLKVSFSDDFVETLLKGKPPQYYKRFSGWCGKNLESPYLKDMIEALISVYAMSVLTKRAEFSDEFIMGQANSLLFMFEEMERLSTLDGFNIKE